MLKIFEFGVLVFDCFVYHQHINVLPGVGIMQVKQKTLII